MLFQPSLEDYEKQTGIELAKHTLAERLQDCNSVEAVTAILCERAKDFDKFREKDKALKSLKKVLIVLHIISSVPSVPDFAQHVELYVPRRRQGVQRL